MIARWSGWSSNRPLADLVFAETGYLLRNLNVPLGVVLVERGRVLRRFVQHHELRHLCPPDRRYFGPADCIQTDGRIQPLCLSYGTHLSFESAQLWRDVWRGHFRTRQRAAARPLPLHTRSRRQAGVSTRTLTTSRAELCRVSVASGHVLVLGSAGAAFLARETEPQAAGSSRRKRLEPPQASARRKPREKNNSANF